MAVTQITTNTSTGSIPTVGLKEWFTTGTVYFVDSNNGADTNNGLSSTQALATLAAAVALCSANVNDIILLMPGHAESLAAETTISTEGISIIGMGNGDNRPQITFTTATAAGLTLAADNITIENVIFKNDIDSQVEMIDVADAAYTLIKNCEFHEGSSKQALIAISITNAGADQCRIYNCRFVSLTAGATSAISIGAAVDQLEIIGCIVQGDYDDACIQNPTATVATNLLISDCYLRNDQTGDHSIQLVSACTGFLVRNVYHNDMTQATGCDPGSCRSFECYHCDAVDTSGILCPVAT